jgi:hypothetical protein
MCQTFVYRFIAGDLWHSGLGWEMFSNPLTLNTAR